MTTRPGARAGAPPGAIAPAIGPKDWALCLGLFALAAVVRLLFLNATVDRELPFSIFYYGDSRLYREFALALLRGESFDQGIPYHPPLFAWFLSLVIRLTGENPWALRALVSLAGALAVPLTWLLGLRLWNRAVALVASLLAVFSFGLSVAAVSPNTEAIYIPILVAQALLLVVLGDALVPVPAGATPQAGGAPRAGRRRARASEEAPGLAGPGAGDKTRERPSPLLTRKILGAAAASGLLLGLGSLTRAEHLLLAAVLPVALLVGWPGASRHRVAAACAAMLAVAAIVIAPWTVHNWLAISRFNGANPDLAEPLPVFVPVSNYGALNFALANNAGADGGFKPDLIVGRTGGSGLDLKDPRQLGLYLHGYREGLSWLLANPAASAALVARKVGISAGAFSLGFGISNSPSGTTGRRRAVDLFAPDAWWFLPVSLALVAAGAWVSRRSWRRWGVVWLLAAHKLVICAAFFGYVRLFVPLLPFAFLLQAAALAAGAAWMAGGGGRMRRRLPAAAGLALAALLLLELGIANTKPRNYNASGSADGATGKLLQDAEIRLSPKE